MIHPLRYVIPLLVSVLVQVNAHAQALHVAPTDSIIRVDGELTESVWQRAEVAGDFIQNFPNDTLPAYNRTDVRMTYDRTHLYVAVVCFDKNRDKPFITSSLKRDWTWDLNDNFTVYMDTFGDRINGFTFNVTPLGVEREGQLFNGERVAPEWDNKWRSAVKVFPDRWQAELMIPLKSIRYRQNTTYFLMNFARHDLKNNQRTAWRRVPVAYNISALAFADTVRFQTPLPGVGPNISLIPYVSGRMTDNRNEGGQQVYKPTIGFDAKIGITPSLNLDLTVNPDFSQVEVDQQVTNLDRFEIFFPERRQFFLENNDLFSDFGFISNRPFFSRRIGIGRDTATGTIVQNPILYGARLSGKLGRNWRIGLLNTQTARQADRGIIPQNYTVGVLQRQVFGRSNLSAIVVNRQGGTDPNDQFTRLAGLEYKLQTTDNRWSGKAFFTQSFRPRRQADAYTHGLNLGYSIRNLSAAWTQEYVGENYQINDLGYVPRQQFRSRTDTISPRPGYWRFAPELNLTFYVKGERRMVSHGPFADMLFIRNLNGRLLDRQFNTGYAFQARNTAEGGVGYYRYFSYLFFGFDPTNSNGPELPTGSAYRTQGLFWFYNSDKRKRFNVQVEGYGGGYYNGSNQNVKAVVQYRFQPYGAVSVNAEYNDLRFPAPYKSAKYLLFGPRVDVTFSRSLFLTTFAQFNNQTRNTNLNARLQWRYAPVSDLFVVYSENYVLGSLQNKNRALVVKLSYWLNV